MSEADGGSLAAELNALADDAEALLQSSASANGAEPQSERLHSSLRSLRDRLERLEEQASARARAVDGYVRENPWEALAIAGGIGLIVGLILASRR